MHTTSIGAISCGVWRY